MSLADDVPQLFRSILDRVAELERYGDRRTAAHLRADAIKAYSTSWDARSWARLQGILRKAERALPANARTEEREVRESVASTV